MVAKFSTFTVHKAQQNFKLLTSLLAIFQRVCEHQAVERKVTEDYIQDLSDDKERASAGDCALYGKLDSRIKEGRMRWTPRSLLLIGRKYGLNCNAAWRGPKQPKNYCKGRQV